MERIIIELIRDTSILLALGVVGKIATDLLGQWLEVKSPLAMSRDRALSEGMKAIAAALEASLFAHPQGGQNQIKAESKAEAMEKGSQILQAVNAGMESAIFLLDESNLGQRVRSLMAFSDGSPAAKGLQLEILAASAENAFEITWTPCVPAEPEISLKEVLPDEIPDEEVILTAYFGCLRSEIEKTGFNLQQFTYRPNPDTHCDRVCFLANADGSSVVSWGKGEKTLRRQVFAAQGKNTAGEEQADGD